LNCIPLFFADVSFEKYLLKLPLTRVCEKNFHQIYNRASPGYTNGVVKFTGCTAHLPAGRQVCSMNAMKTNEACKTLYERLRANGKTSKQALVAVMNKLLKQFLRW
jgi:hypothetical protein